MPADPLWYHEIIDVRDGDGCKTGHGAAFLSEKKARASFDTFRQLNVTDARHAFLLDLHAADGTLIDTILLDAAGFKQVTGEHPKSAAHHARVDRKFWCDAIHYREVAHAR